MHGPSPPLACWPSPRSSSSSPSRHQRGSWTLSRRKTSSYTRASGKSAGTGSTPKRSNVASMIPCPVRYVKPIMTSSNGNISASLTLCAGNPPITGGFLSQRDSNADPWCLNKHCWRNTRMTCNSARHGGHLTSPSCHEAFVETASDLCNAN